MHYESALLKGPSSSRAGLTTSHNPSGPMTSPRYTPSAPGYVLLPTHQAPLAEPEEAFGGAGAEMPSAQRQNLLYSASGLNTTSTTTSSTAEQRNHNGIDSGVSV